MVRLFCYTELMKTEDEREASIKKEHVVIYVTGLNDKKVSFQRRAVSSWRIYNVTPILFQTNWSDSKSFSEKLGKLIELIDEYYEKEFKVSLVGASAGASLVVAAYARRKQTVSGVVFICGKLRRPEAVGANYYLQNPAFREAMSTLKDNLQILTKSERARIMSIHPLFDETVVVSDTIVGGAKRFVLPTLFHVPTIALAITLFSFVPIIFLKNKSAGRG